MAPLQRIKNFCRHNPLGLRLLTAILICSSAITLVATATQLWLDYRYELSAIDERLYQIETSSIKSLSNSLWEISPAQVQVQSAGRCSTWNVNRHRMMEVLKETLRRDKAKNHIVQLSDLGLVEMTRKRTRESLEQLMCESCPTCEGRGTMRTPETTCYEIFREIMRDARAYENDTLMVLATQGVVDRLLDEESANVADLEEFIGKTISFRVEPDNNPEHFDIVLL